MRSPGKINHITKLILTNLLICAIFIAPVGTALADNGNIKPPYFELALQPGESYATSVSVVINPPPAINGNPQPEIPGVFKVTPVQLSPQGYVKVIFAPLIILEWVKKVPGGPKVDIPQAVIVDPDTPPGKYLVECAFEVSQPSTGYSQNLGKQAILVTVSNPAPPGLVKITGGGQVILPPGEHHSHSFGFVIQPDHTGLLSVNLEYNDNHYGSASGKKHAFSPLQIKINDYALKSNLILDSSGNIIGLNFKAPAYVRILDPENGEVNIYNDLEAYVEVIDNGEPGVGVDWFKLEFKNAPPPVTKYSSLGGILDSGNIQLHTH